MKRIAYLLTMPAKAYFLEVYRDNRTNTNTFYCWYWLLFGVIFVVP